MAGPAPDFQLPNSSLFNIYNDAPANAPLTTPLTTPPPNLPGGPCNFVDLTHGANGPKCGCRRFWSRAVSVRPERGSPTGYPPGFSNALSYGTTAGVEDQSAWCMCSHHACFHDDIRDSQATAVPGAPVAATATALVAAAAATTTTTTTTTAGQENERPKSNREPLTPVLPELSIKFPNLMGQPTEFHNTFDTIASFPHPLPDEDNLAREEVSAPTPAPEPSLPDTLSWANFLHSEPDNSALLAPIPSQCLLPSQPSSTTSSTRIGYLRPFAGKGLQTLSGVKSRLREPLPEQDEDDQQQEDDNATEPAVDPSVDDAQTITNTPRSSRHTEIFEGPSEQPNKGVHRDEFRLLSNTVQGHEQRLDNLENISFSAAGHDQCHEKHDQTDLRVTELETRVEEVEKMLNDTNSTASDYHRSRRPGIDDTSSVVSVSTNGSSHVADRAELYSQLQFLKAQLSHLQGISTFPSLARPWEVEVIFLPFPLKNIWLEPRDFNSQRASGSTMEADPWTQLPGCSSPLDPQSPGFNDWMGPEVESDWLLARACAPDQTIGQRLRSRGLVKNVSIRGPDARSVQQAMSEAFGTLFRTFSRMQANVHHGSTMHQRVVKFLGLQSPWVPLRKIHKDSRLRFLTPAEMVTPVTWDVQFLSSSVVMKSNDIPRLFITHPEAYLQDQDAYDNGWNWQRLRELSRVYADSQCSQEVPEGDAKEECWAWNTNLDEQPPSMYHTHYSSLQQAAQQNWRTVSMSPSQGAFPGGLRPTPSLATHRSGTRAQSPAIPKERKASRPPRVRTTSMPPTLPALISPAQVKRRLTSYIPTYERRPSPLVQVAPATAHTQVPAQTHAYAYAAGAAKRRCTRSPSVRPGGQIPQCPPPPHARGFNNRRNTPRWSTASPSPMPEAYGVRATTPFYATPYSNAPFVETRPNRGVVMADAGGEDEDIDVDVDVDVDFYSGMEPYDEDDEDENGEIDYGEDGDSPMEDLANSLEQSHPNTHPLSQQSLNSSWHHQFAGTPDVGAGAGSTNLPEDEPWPGIEDADNRDPDLGINPDAMHEDDDVGFDSEEDVVNIRVDRAESRSHREASTASSSSNSSSVPSEYPTTQSHWFGANAGAAVSGDLGEGGFNVFMDREGGAAGAGIGGVMEKPV
ncbi:hypothetical protein F4809DRAFT_636693 [Biscogniauxia mediterranea]|nr:hypothetical protein F4809DRAFT_636693 [Biscogniauxia mediterranea]